MIYKIMKEELAILAIASMLLAATAAMPWQLTNAQLFGQQQQRCTEAEPIIIPLHCYALAS
jgi:hypothetical protein